MIAALLLASLVLCGGVLAFTIPALTRSLDEAKEPTSSGQVQPAPGKPGEGEAAPAAPHAKPAAEDDGIDWVKVGAWWFAGWAAVGSVGLSGLAVKLIRQRLRARLTRDYRLYELHLSMHDEAKQHDLEDMVEAIANIVRAFPEDRAQTGQPYIAFESHFGPSTNGMEWTLAIRCEERLAKAIDGAIAGAYPDVRVGYVHGDDPQPLEGRLPKPGWVLRYRKKRPFVYALSSESDESSSPPLEAIAQAQASLGKPSSVRFQLTPTPLAVEEWARRRFRRHENKLVRSETWGASEAGLRSSLNQQEMREGKRTQNRSMFWLEVQVAAETREDANHIGAAVQARRADNVLHRRWMFWGRRLELYRERFPTAYPPLWPTPSLRSLVSSAEIAYLLELPSARMKGVPVRRMAVPRLPAPPEVARGADEGVATPPPGVPDVDLELPPPLEV
jgi:hypothetical protein